MLEASALSERQILLFWSKVDFGELDKCWPWKAGCSRNGYGAFSISSQNVGAHRVAMAISEGSVAKGVFVCHRCDNPPCCNPAHLFIGTAKENTADMFEKGRFRMPNMLSPKRHNVGSWRAKNMPFLGSSHPAAKLTELDVRRIKLALANSIRGVDCAAAFGCSVHTVSNINRGKQWKHV